MADKDCEGSLIVAEYSALRAEILDHLDTTRTLAGLYLAIVGGIAGAVTSGRLSPNMIAVIPILGSLFWWIHLDARFAISKIGHYLDEDLKDRAHALSSDRVLRWEEYLRRPPERACSHGSRIYRTKSALVSMAWRGQFIYFPHCSPSS